MVLTLAFFFRTCYPLKLNAGTQQDLNVQLVEGFRSDHSSACFFFKKKILIHTMALLLLKL